MNHSVRQAASLKRLWKLSRVVSALIAGVLAVGLVGCSSSPPKEAEHAATVADSSASDAPFDTTRVLAIIEGVSASSEDLYDMAKAGDWMKAAAGVDSLKEFSQQLRSTVSGRAEQQDRLGKAVAALDLGVGSKDRLVAMREANAVTLVGIDLDAEFMPLVPADVARLDYYGRELEIGAESGDLKILQQAADGARSAWAAVSPAVEAHGGTAEAKKFSALMTKTESAKTPADFGRLATPILEEVDNLERVFEKK